MDREPLSIAQGIIFGIEVMASEDRRRKEALDWYEGAIVDLDEAEDALSGGRGNWALFAAHQAVEKAMKAAYMSLRRERAPRTHDLVEMHTQLGIKLQEDLAQALSELTPYYTVARYPNAGLEKPWIGINRAVAMRLVDAAREIVERVGCLAELKS